MDWKCSCKTSNADNLDKCSNCGRAKPKYFGIKIHFTPNETFDNKKLSIWYLKVALKYIDTAKEKLERIDKSKLEHKSNEKIPENIIALWEHLKKRIILDCTNCFIMIDEAEKIDEKPGFENEEGIIVTSISIRSDSHYLLGSTFFALNNFEEAVNQFQKSFDLDPNQFSIYNLALSTINLPVEGKSVFSSKKTNQAVENKKQQEIELLKLTIKFSPFSELGLIAAQVLKDNYDYIVTITDLK